MKVTGTGGTMKNETESKHSHDLKPNQAKNAAVWSAVRENDEQVLFLRKLLNLMEQVPDEHQEF